MSGYQVIDPSSRIADDVHIGPFVMIGPNVEIGSGTRIEGFVSIGTPAEHRDHYHDPGPYGVRIGANCVIREFVTINAGTLGPTVIADDVAVLCGSYIAHDTVVEQEATISGGAFIGGHSWIGPQANLGLGVAVHQYRAIGGLAMVGMHATVTRDLPPLTISMGSPARATGINRLGLERAGLNVDAVARWWDLGASTSDPIQLPEGAAIFCSEWSQHCIAHR